MNTPIWATTAEFELLHDSTAPTTVTATNARKIGLGRTARRGRRVVDSAYTFKTVRGWVCACRCRHRGSAPPRLSNVRSSRYREARMRVLGVDPGLPRCGIGVVEG